jgi:DNA-binding response OmpR family regulator
LLVTGETRPERIDAINAQAIATLFKPVTPKQLREAILAAVLATQAAQTASASSN